MKSKITKPPTNACPDWAQYDNVLDGVKKMQPAIAALQEELLAAQRADKAKKRKRHAYHMRRVVNALFNLHRYFWQPMFEWSQMEFFLQSQKRIKRKNK